MGQKAYEGKIILGLLSMFCAAGVFTTCVQAKENAHVITYEEHLEADAYGENSHTYTYEENLEADAYGEDMDVDAYGEDLLEDIEFDEIEELLDETFEEDISFEQMVRDMIRGKIPIEKGLVGHLLETCFVSEVKEHGRAMVYVLLLAVLSALLTNFTRIFERSQIADIGFYVVYLLLLAILIQSFQTVNSIAESVLGQMTEFMKLLMPVYMITIAAAKGGTTATVFYEFLIMLIYGVNFLLFRILLPLCNVYVVLGLVNYISREDMLSKLTGLIKQLIGWGLKTLLGVVIGLNVVQGLITPALDTFKTSTMHKAVSAIPGVGTTMNAVTEVVIGSGMLIKNGIGVGILVVLVLISLVPVLKVGVSMLLYKLVAAVIQPITDKRMSDCIHVVSEGTRLLLKCVITSLVLFFITVAILAVSTSW